jgi:hypothetical protein
MSIIEQTYPRWKFHRTLPARVASNPDFEAALGPGWADSPAAFNEPVAIEEIDAPAAALEQLGTETAAATAEADPSIEDAPATPTAVKPPKGGQKAEKPASKLVPAKRAATAKRA